MVRLTPQRRAILDLINQSNRHWDAEEVARALADAGCSMGIATVYRGLAALEAQGLIASVQLAGKRRYERADKAHHDHLFCTECGGLEEFVHDKIEALQREVAAANGFRMRGHQLLIFGICRRCQAKTG